MPKKLQGENTKAVAARARDAAKRADELEKKKQKEEDEYWRDDDKNISKKLQRKEEKDQKKHEIVQRKQEAKQLLEKEMESIGAAKTGPTKVTQHQIVADQERQRIEKLKAEEKAKLEAKKIAVVEDAVLLQENVNKLEIEGLHARGVDEAIKVLSTGAGEDLDRHPEKRLKAAFVEYEERNLARLKAENPNLRLSQLKQMLKKDWLKSPENPMNQI